jgi:hypothetical protein
MVGGGDGLTLAEVPGEGAEESEGNGFEGELAHAEQGGGGGHLCVEGKDEGREEDVLDGQDDERELEQAKGEAGGELIPEQAGDEDAGDDGLGVGEVGGDEDVEAVGEAVDLVVGEVGEVVEDLGGGGCEEWLGREEDERVEGSRGEELEPEVFE